MNSTLRRLSLPVIFLLLLASSSARAQEDRNTQIFKQLYSKLVNTLSVGSNSVAPGHSFLVLANPGIVLPPGLDMSKADDRAKLTRLTWKVPYPSFVLQESALTIPGVWDYVLANKDTPKIKLTSDEEKELKRVRKLLFDGDGPSKTYRLYQRYRSQYGQAVDILDASRRESQRTGIPVLSSTVDAVTQTAEEWDLYGSKANVETALENYRELSSKDPAGWWAELQNRRRTNVEKLTNGSNSPITFFTPDYDVWQNQYGWAPFHFDDKDVLTEARSRHTSVGGGGSAGWGLWRVSASYSYDETSTYSMSDVKGLAVSAKVMRVSIDRPWLEATVFRSRAWKWKSTIGAKAEPISDGGDIDQGITPKGMMPLLVTGLLLARDVKIGGTWDSKELSTFESHLKAGGSVGWGPFSLGGNYAEDKAESRFSGQFSTSGLESPAVQIIGFYCDVLPMSPYPDPSLDWGGPLGLADFPTLVGAGYLKGSQADLFKAMEVQLKPK